ncbi:potassium voltage-gated channel subfamily A member 2-like [Actinia tenebrosa]|uniref:Potassium voltage-gated channel subfamily A member 2-like n=1 Tax=Actinia tenebrosa TaxID=6105 RepID=A0A6P8HJ44_ACTTE|nr:potassium voltage-gated channel subfamily A member 2-like [Actinia tenebrosa]
MVVILYWRPKCELFHSGSSKMSDKERGTEMLPVLFDDRIVINVSGMIFETREETLARFPNSLLGSLGKRNTYYIPESNEYFFNRNRMAFEAILYFYQSHGRLRRPSEVPMRIFKQEIEFFELGEDILHDMLINEGYIEESKPSLPTNSLQRKLWELFEHPDSSLIATILVLFSIFMIVAAVLTSIIESSVKKGYLMQTSEAENPNDASMGDRTIRMTMDPWFLLEVIFNSWFTLEFLIRLFASPDKCQFLTGLLNIVDLVAVLPFYISIALDSSKSNSVTVLRVLRIIRVFRMFKLSRYSRSLQVIGYCVRESIRELGLLVLCLFLSVVVTSSLLYYAEVGHKGTSFTSVPETFWFSIQTITTIGYGDMVPKTALGKLLSAICALFGAITLALPVLTFVSNFNKLYYKNMKDNFSIEESSEARKPSGTDIDSQTSVIEISGKS